MHLVDNDVQMHMFMCDINEENIRTIHRNLHEDGACVILLIPYPFMVAQGYEMSGQALPRGSTFGEHKSGRGGTEATSGQPTAVYPIFTPLKSGGGGMGGSGRKPPTSKNPNEIGTPTSTHCLQSNGCRGHTRV